jgi:sulfur carrier protein
VTTLQVNGKRVELESPTPLLAYLERLGVNPRAVAVEHNGEILERAAYASITLREGDRVEIVRMVGGGAGRAQGAPLPSRPSAAP